MSSFLSPSCLLAASSAVWQSKFWNPFFSRPHFQFTLKFMAVPYGLRVKHHVNGIADVLLFILIIPDLADREWNLPALPLLVILSNFLEAGLLDHGGGANINEELPNRVMFKHLPYIPISYFASAKASFWSKTVGRASPVSSPSAIRSLFQANEGTRRTPENAIWKLK